MVTLTPLSTFFSWLVASLECTKWWRAVLAAAAEGKQKLVSKSIQDVYAAYLAHV